MAEFPIISPYQAVKRDLEEISGGDYRDQQPVMVSVFLPISFMSGPVGTFLSTVSDTMASLGSWCSSNHCTDSYSCTLCYATQMNNPWQTKWRQNILLQVSGWFQIGYLINLTGKYVRLTGEEWSAGRWLTFFGILAAFVRESILKSKFLPSGFIPRKDQEHLWRIIQLPFPSYTRATNGSCSTTVRNIVPKTKSMAYESVPPHCRFYEIMTKVGDKCR